MEPTDTDDDIDIRGDPGSLPPTLYVLELAAGVPAATVDWYISRVQGRRRTGGAELLVSAQPQLPGKVSGAAQQAGAGASVAPSPSCLARLVA